MLPHGAYIATVEPFWTTNRLWLIRQVVLPSYNDSTYQAADLGGALVRVIGAPFSHERIIQYVADIVGEDDWVDALLLDGRRLRNLRRSLLWPK